MRRRQQQLEKFRHKDINPKLFLRPLNATKQKYFYVPLTVLGLRDGLEPGETVTLIEVVRRDSRGRGGKVVVTVENENDEKHNVFLEDLIIRGYQ